MILDTQDKTSQEKTFILKQEFFFTIAEALFSLGPEELGTLDDINKPDAKVFKTFL